MTQEEPFYRMHVFCCNNERPPGHARGCCKERGADVLRNYMRARVKELDLKGVRINVAGCLDRCDLGPVMVVYPEGVWYRAESEADIEEIVTRHLEGGERVERLVLKNDRK